MQRIVLVHAAQHLYGSFQLFFPANQRILLLVRIVHARHQMLPCCIRLPFFSCFFSQLVVITIEVNEVTHETGLLTLDTFIQQVGSPRILQLKDTFCQMGNVHRLGTAQSHLLHCRLNHLRHLCRCLWLVFHILWYRFYVFKILFDTIIQLLSTIEYD